MIINLAICVQTFSTVASIFFMEDFTQASMFAWICNVFAHLIIGCVIWNLIISSKYSKLINISFQDTIVQLIKNDLIVNSHYMILDTKISIMKLFHANKKLITSCIAIKFSHIHIRHITVLICIMYFNEFKDEDFTGISELIVTYI